MRNESTCESLLTLTRVDGDAEGGNVKGSFWRPSVETARVRGVGRAKMGSLVYLRCGPYGRIKVVR